MRKVADPELADRLTVVVDPDAYPVDVDAVVARFLLKFVRSQATRSVDAAAAVEVDHSVADTERQTV